MTRDEILAMKPGRELDCLISERVFAKEIICREPGFAPEGSPWTMLPGDEGEHVQPWRVEICMCDGKPDMKAAFSDYERALTERIGHNLYCLNVVPFYSTSIADAWPVVEEMKNRGKVFIIKADGLMRGDFQPCYSVQCGNQRDMVRAETAPEAIARAP